MEQVRGEIARLRPRCSVIDITNGVDLGRFRPRDGQDDVSRWRFGAGRVVMILGHLSDVKGYPTFLRSAALLKKAIGDCAFVAVGGETIQAGFKTELLRQAESLGVKDDVHFIGWQNDVAPVLRAADVVALPSLDEGLPLAVLEAMASGVPVVATPVGGVPEAVVDGVTGRLVPPENPGALADAIRHLLSDPQLLRSMGDEARKRAEQQYSLDRHAELTMVAYERLLSAPAY
jgi:glycosyltransferase involved in cell wall biosynthesis